MTCVNARSKTTMDATGTPAGRIAVGGRKGGEGMDQLEPLGELYPEKYNIQMRMAAAHILAFFSEQKFTVDEAQHILDMAGQWITATTTVNADKQIISQFLNFDFG